MALGPQKKRQKGRNGTSSIASMEKTLWTHRDLNIVFEKEINVNDVLCGRGIQNFRSAGNIMYHTLVNHVIPDYAAAKVEIDKTTFQ